MKRNGIINRDISCVLSTMGHTDLICIADCGLPIPDDIPCIDLSISLGEPTFQRVLCELLTDMKVEVVYLAEEITQSNQDQMGATLDVLIAKADNPEVVFVSHDELKRMSSTCKAIIRTGENTPYSNIILQSACIF